MKKYSDRKIVMVKRKTNLEEIIKRYNTVLQAQFHIQSIGGDFSDYLKEHETYHSAVRVLYEKLNGLGIVQLLDREYVQNYVFGPKDIVVVIGQDGLVANTMKYLE